MNVYELVAENNIAKSLDEDKLTKIGKEVIEGFDMDKKSRQEWENKIKEYYKLALQVCEEKTFPWPKASNIKFPLIATAAMQFNARAYPTLVPSTGKIVNCKTFGNDPDGQKFQRARRVSTFMNFQLMYEMEEWEEDTDRLLSIVPIVGCAFKKTYYDANKKRNCSKLILPQNLVVNYWADTLENSFRVSEMIEMNKHQVKERQLKEIFLDVDLGDPSTTVFSEEEDMSNKAEMPQVDDSTPYLFIEQHTFLDLDEDGLVEPYIITVEYSSQKVVRIVARFKEENIDTNVEGKVVEIRPDHYYTKFGFFPNSEGGFYDLGFGHLLGPINQAVDTIINQLVDAGTLRNLQSGFLGKGIRLRKGQERFGVGEWKEVNSVGDDLRKQIVPLPSNEPSKVLFELLGLMIQSGKELASIAEIFVGKMPGQNTPAYTTKETVEQGMKLFTAIYKRIYRSFTKEFKKLYYLNKYYLDQQEYVDVLDEPVQQSDFDAPPNDICPAADPSASSQTEKMAKAEAKLQLLQLGTIDPMAVTMEFLEALGDAEPQKSLRQPSPPPPDPKLEAIKAKAETDAAKTQMDMAKSQHDMKLKEMEFMLKQQEQAMNMKFEQQRQEMQMQFEMVKQALQSRGEQMKMATEGMKSQQQLQMNKEKHEQSIEQARQKVREPKRPNKGG